MMKISKKIWISIAIVFGMVWYMGNFYAALDYVILVSVSYTHLTLPTILRV